MGEGIRYVQVMCGYETAEALEAPYVGPMKGLVISSANVARVVLWGLPRDWE